MSKIKPRDAEKILREKNYDDDDISLVIDGLNELEMLDGSLEMKMIEATDDVIAAITKSSLNEFNAMNLLHLIDKCTRLIEENAIAESIILRKDMLKQGTAYTEFTEQEFIDDTLKRLREKEKKVPDR